MPWKPIADLGVGPANEDCAQLGRNPNYEAQSALELTIYQAALIALNGSPQRGLRYSTKSHAHDFGTYFTLILEYDPEQYDTEMAHIYAERLTVPHSWIMAGFRHPIEPDERESVPTRTSTECIASALSITRPGPDGTFYPLTNAALHNSLLTEYPAAADLYRTNHPNL